MQTRILYIEDEVHLSRAVKDSLERKGFEVVLKKDGTNILEHVKVIAPDICLLDVMLPRIDGFTLGGMIRSAYSKLPIIFLTAKSQTTDVLAGFASGGTDYLRKPFNMDELVARIENQIHLSKASFLNTDFPAKINIGSFSFYPALYELHTDDGGVQQLSYREVQLLSLMVQYINRPVERRLLLQTIWGNDNLFNSRNLDVYIRKLRQRLSCDARIELKTLKSVGYHLIVRD
ncbi:MAG: response regulator transcription factor [Chitinophagaceae bacterium]